MSAHSTTLPRSPGSVGVARRLVQTHATTLSSHQGDDAVLMVSELVTNALVHGTGTIALRIDVASDTLRVEVSDEGNVALAPSPTPGAHGGWGLRIVDQLADDWGVRRAARRSGSGSARRYARAENRRARCGRRARPVPTRPLERPYQARRRHLGRFIIVGLHFLTPQPAHPGMAFDDPSVGGLHASRWRVLSRRGARRPSR
jgi:anti-sigma regulatory factor (Ser/Thr protein kinase)